MIKSNPPTKRNRQLIKPENKLSLPFIEKYKDKITRVSREGPIKSQIPELPPLNQSKAVSRKSLEKENQSEMMNLGVGKK